MYKLLNNGRFPFMPAYPQRFTQADIDASFTQRISGTDVQRLATVNDSLMNIIIKACSFDPQYRYQSAVEMKNDLSSIANFVDYELTMNSVDITDTTISTIGVLSSLNSESEKIAHIPIDNFSTIHSPISERLISQVLEVP